MKKQQKDTKDKVRILIVDDHPIMRQGLAQLINQDMKLAVCGEAEDANQALDIIHDTNPQMVIVDISLKGPSGIELIKNIKVRYPSLPVLVLSMHDESLYAERAFRAGARGYIMKEEGTEKVMMAIHQILGGALYMSNKIGSKLLHKFFDTRIAKSDSPIEFLSDRELEVFRLLGRGLGTRKVAEELNLSIKTIETYRAHIKNKLKLKNASELIQNAVQWVQSENLT
ncbi:MAG: response regulator transcription factor [bacterium]